MKVSLIMSLSALSAGHGYSAVEMHLQFWVMSGYGWFGRWGRDEQRPAKNVALMATTSIDRS